MTRGMTVADFAPNSATFGLQPSPSFGVKLLTLVPFGRVRPRTLPTWELLITGALTRCRGCCIRRRIYNYCRGGTLWRR